VAGSETWAAATSTATTTTTALAALRTCAGHPPTCPAAHSGRTEARAGLVNLFTLLRSRLLPRLRSRLLHFSLGLLQLLPRAAELPTRLPCLLTVLSVLLNLRVQVLAILNPLLLKVADALAELIQLLGPQTIPILQAILVLSLKAVLLPRLVRLLGGQGQHRATHNQKDSGQGAQNLEQLLIDVLMCH
jgi:hypothetical protein